MERTQLSARARRVRSLIGLAAVVALGLSLSPHPAHAASSGTPTCTAPCPPTFTAPPLTSMGAPGVEQAGIYSLAQGDFDGNGTTDIAGVAYGGADGASETTGVAVFLGHGDGTLATPVNYPAGLYPIQVNTGRLRGPNAPLDLVVVDAGADAKGVTTIAVLLGNGDGTFQPPALYELPAVSSAILADVNGDGRADLVASAHVGIGSVPNELTVYLSKGDGTLAAPVSYQAGDGLSADQQIEVADVNGDGKADIVGLDSDGLWLSLGNGDGTFLPAVKFWSDPTGGSTGGLTTGVTWFALSPLRGTSTPDIAVDIGGGRVDVLLNSGAGVFAPAGEYTIDQHQASGAGGGAIAAADVDGDGHPDLVVATGFGGTLVVLRGDGTGTFATTPAVYPLPHVWNNAMLVTTFGGDTLPSVVVAGSFGAVNGDVNFFTVLRTQGDGTFASPRQFAVTAPYDNPTVNPTNPIGPALADLNGDGKLDLVVTEWDYPVETFTNGQVPMPPTVNPTAGSVQAGSSVAVMLGNGDGTFGPEHQYEVGNRPAAVVARDLDGDGHPDLVVVNAASNTVSVLRGNGDGTFQPAITLPAGSGPNSLVVADVNGDGRPDIVFTNNGDNTVSVILNQSTPGNMAFAARTDNAVGTGPSTVVTGDFNRDGALDLAVVGYGDYLSDGPSPLSVLLGRGDGTFAPATTTDIWPTSGGDALVAADFNGDGIPDLAAANFSRGALDILQGRGDGSFAKSAEYSVGEGPESIVAADLNGDGALDLAVDNLNDGSVTALVGTGDGTFVAAASHTDPALRPYGWAVFPYPTFLAAGDLDGDGRVDLVTPNLFDNAVTVLMNTTAPGPSTVVPEAPLPVVFVIGAAALAVATRRHGRRRLRRAR